MTTIGATVLILAAHGVPAADYPSWRVGLLMMLETSGELIRRFSFLRRWRDVLDHQMRGWPRTNQNDPYKSAVDELASRLETYMGCQVLVGYNEFCAPTIMEAIDRAVVVGARRIVVLPTMIMRGNEHTEREIYEVVVDARQRYPVIEVHYAFPFDLERVVAFLAEQAACYLNVVRSM